jgi:penicillin-binding protein 1A
MVKVDRGSGQRVFGGVPSDEAKAEVIWEAFKPETEPTRVTRQEQVVAKRSGIARRDPARFQRRFGQGQPERPAGGLRGGSGRGLLNLSGR